MKNFRQVLSRNAQQIGAIVIPGGNNHLPANVVEDSAQPVASGDVKIIVFAHYRFDPLVLANVELVMFC